MIDYRNNIGKHLIAEWPLVKAGVWATECIQHHRTLLLNIVRLIYLVPGYVSHDVHALKWDVMLLMRRGEGGGVHFVLPNGFASLQTPQALTGESTVRVPIDKYSEVVHRVTMEVRWIDPSRCIVLCVLYSI